MIEATAPASRELAYREIDEFVYRANEFLDAKDFKSWLDMCSEDFTYRIRTFSPEIRKEMVWLEHDFDGMTTLVKHLPRHNTDQSVFTRHTTVYNVTFDETQSRATVVSAVTVYRTTLDGGMTSLFATGRYHDVVVNGDAGLRFALREVRLDTRNLGIGTHYPL